MILVYRVKAVIIMLCGGTSACTDWKSLLQKLEQHGCIAVWKNACRWDNKAFHILCFTHYKVIKWSMARITPVHFALILFLIDKLAITSTPLTIQSILLTIVMLDTSLLWSFDQLTIIQRLIICVAFNSSSMQCVSS